MPTLGKLSPLSDNFLVGGMVTTFGSGVGSSFLVVCFKSFLKMSDKYCSFCMAGSSTCTGCAGCGCLSTWIKSFSAVVAVSFDESVGISVYLGEMDGAGNDWTESCGLYGFVTLVVVKDRTNVPTIICMGFPSVSIGWVFKQ